MLARLVVTVLAAAMLAGCQSNEQGSGNTDEAPVEPETSRYLVDEGMPPIASIVKYVPISQDSALAVDSEDGLFLFIEDHRAGMLGLRGRGPCEYEEVTSLAVVGDTVFVLDRTLVRIVGYSIGTGACLTEVSHPEMSGVDNLGRAGGWYYLLRGIGSSMFPADYVLLYRLDDKGRFEPLGFTAGDLQADFMMHGLENWNRAIQECEGGLYFTVPLSHRVWRYDIQSGEVFSFQIELSSLDLADYADVDLSAQPEIFRELEVERNLFLLDDHVSVLTLRGFRNWYLGLYTYDGNLIAIDTVTSHIYFVERGNYYTLVGTDSETEIYEIRRVLPPAVP